MLALLSTPRIVLAAHHHNRLRQSQTSPRNLQVGHHRTDFSTGPHANLMLVSTVLDITNTVDAGKITSLALSSKVRGPKPEDKLESKPERNGPAFNKAIAGTLDLRGKNVDGDSAAVDDDPIDAAIRTGHARRVEPELETARLADGRAGAVQRERIPERHDARDHTRAVRIPARQEAKRESRRRGRGVAAWERRVRIRVCVGVGMMGGGRERGLVQVRDAHAADVSCVRLLVKSEEAGFQVSKP